MKNQKTGKAVLLLSDRHELITKQKSDFTHNEDNKKPLFINNKSLNLREHGAEIY